ncbi:MAG TPA: hypothetical protein VMV46_06165 [Thermoanaerobaculia bacterium]|nr:hypothetical protein [Thermoanaerobaculia bacterium]
MGRQQATEPRDLAAEAPCDPALEFCSSVAPSPGQEFLRQALGSNQEDMRLPSILLSLALAAAVVAWLLRRRSAASGSDRSER